MREHAVDITFFSFVMTTSSLFMGTYQASSPWRAQHSHYYTTALYLSDFLPSALLLHPSHSHVLLP